MNILELIDKRKILGWLSSYADFFKYGFLSLVKADRYRSWIKIIDKWKMRLSEIKLINLWRSKYSLIILSSLVNEFLSL